MLRNAGDAGRVAGEPVPCCCMQPCKHGVLWWRGVWRACRKLRLQLHGPPPGCSCRRCDGWAAAASSPVHQVYRGNCTDAVSVCHETPMVRCLAPKAVSGTGWVGSGVWRAGVVGAAFGQPGCISKGMQPCGRGAGCSQHAWGVLLGKLPPVTGRGQPILDQIACTAARAAACLHHAGPQPGRLLHRMWRVC